MFRLIALIFCVFTCCVLPAQNYRIFGKVTGTSLKPIEYVRVSIDTLETYTDEKGDYELFFPKKKNVRIAFLSIDGQFQQREVLFENIQDYQLDIRFPLLDVQQIGEVILNTDIKNKEGTTLLESEVLQNAPSANGGIEAVLKTLPGVSSNNELSSQYNVRGGSFDENLIYVNDIPIYRPFLIRSGQQEGLSFVNPDLTKSVRFYAGGFEAKYGDKLSSVLDVTYQQPTENKFKASISLLGLDTSWSYLSKDKKTNFITGTRYRDNSLFVTRNSDFQVNYFPRFFDTQFYVNHKINERMQLGVLGNIALNMYNFQPISRVTNFGTFDSPKSIVIHYEGQENDTYQTFLGGVNFDYQPQSNIDLKFIATAFRTLEQEYFDIESSYIVGDVNIVPGSDETTISSIDGIGSNLAHARNDLDALIFNIQQKGVFRYNNNKIDWGVRYAYGSFIDRVDEFEFASDSGVLLGGVSDETPLNPFDNEDDRLILPYRSANSFTELTTQKVFTYLQWRRTYHLGAHSIALNTGGRTQYRYLSVLDGENHKEWLFSPRVKLSWHPAFNSKMSFRLASGLYQQAPFYRELRNAVAQINAKVDSQKSFHISLAHDYDLQLWERPFKLVSEMYYKYLTDVNTYTVDNVRLTYSAHNNAVAYAYGLDVRMNGEFVPGTESWLSIGLLKTEENQSGRGWISRPTDQRFKFALLFQDYVPSQPNLKMYLNLVYQTGVPGGSPIGADPYLYQSRLSDYKRVDIGSSWVLVNNYEAIKESPFLQRFRNLELGIEVFNLFDTANSITNIFVRDATTGNQFAIPNFLSPRIFNIKMKVGW